MTDQDIDTTTLATDRECLEIEAKARTRKVFHWPELVRMINRMRHWQARAEAAEKREAALREALEEIEDLAFVKLIDAYSIASTALEAKP